MKLRQAQLPKDWEIKKLGDLCNLMTGGTPSRSKPEYFINGEIKWLVSGDIHKGEIFNCEGRITKEALANSNAKYLPINSVVIALNGQGKTRGTVALLRTRATCNQSLVSIYPKNKIKVLPEYIFCNLHGRYEEIRRITGDDGNDRRGLNMPLIRNIEVPLPPLAEQKRIVAILDNALTAIAKAKTNAEQNLKNAKELFESYLHGVFENKSEGWEEKKLSAITSKIGSGATPRGGKASYKIEGVSLVRSMNVHDFEFREKNLAFIDEGQADALSNVTLQEDDILLNITGASIARCCIIPKQYLPARVNQHVSIIRAKKDLVFPLFLGSLLTSNFYKYQILETGEQGATRQAITKAQLENIKITMPKTIKEQQSIVKRLDTLSTETKKIEAIYQQKIEDLEELKKSILQMAFNGELTENEIAL